VETHKIAVAFEIDEQGRPNILAGPASRIFSLFAAAAIDATSHDPRAPRASRFSSFRQ
jgi:hypothetical protein